MTPTEARAKFEEALTAHEDATGKWFVGDGERAQVDRRARTRAAVLAAAEAMVEAERERAALVADEHDDRLSIPDDADEMFVRGFREASQSIAAAIRGGE